MGFRRTSQGCSPRMHSSSSSPVEMMATCFRTCGLHLSLAVVALPLTAHCAKRCRTTWTTRASAWARAPGSAMCSAASSGDSACASRSSLSTLGLWTSLQPTGALGRGAWVTRSAAAFESQQEVFGTRALCHRRRLPRLVHRGRWFRLRPVLHRDGTESGACRRQARALTVSASGALTGDCGSTLVASFLT